MSQPLDSLAGPGLPAIRHFVEDGRRYAGAVDYLDSVAGIRGWVVEPAAPGRPVEVGLRCRGIRLATTHAIMDRPDLDAVLGRVTQCGFLLGWSRFDAAALARLAAESPDAPLDAFVVGTGQSIPVMRDPITAAEAHLLRLASPAGDLLPHFREVEDHREILASGLFDEAWYVARHGARIAHGMPPLLHYMREGEAAGLRPNFLFDPVWYAAAAGLPDPEGALLHLIRDGALDGIPASPHLDEAWYREAHAVPAGTHPLAHHLAHREDTAPNPWFDAAWYAEASGQPPGPGLYEHFAATGFAAGLLPSPLLDPAADLPPERLLAAQRFLAGLRGHPPQVPAATTRDAVPPATSLGYAETEALLSAATPERRARILALAERQMEGDGRGRADAALTCAIGRILAGDHAGATQAIAVFLSARPQPAGRAGAVTADEIGTRLLAAAHALHEDRQGEAAQRLYRLLFAHGRQDAQSLIRMLDAELDRRDLTAAAPFAAALEAMPPGRAGTWGAIALARFQALSGQAARARAILSAIPPFPATEPVAEAVILHRMIEAEGLEEAEARARHSAASLAPEIFGVQLRLAVRRRDGGAVAAMLEDPRAERLRDWQLAEAMAQLGAPGRLPPARQQAVLNRLERLLAPRGVADKGVALARISHLLQARRWEELRALLEEVAATPFGASREVALRRLEFLCHAGEAEAARRLYAAEFREAAPTKWESLTILHLLAELQDWEEAGRVLLRHVGAGQDLGPALHTALRIARRTGLHAALLERGAAAGPRPEPGLGEFLLRVREDLALREGARALAVPEAAGFRSNWVLPAAVEEAEAGRHCIFLCTNRRYFLSALTFLCSLLGQAPQTGARIFVFLDADVPRRWQGAIAMVAARFGREVEVVAEDAFMPRAVAHRTGYGFFAAGRDLSRAAYFRLYAARWLLEGHRFRRAAYLDTDTICRGDISALFGLDLGEGLVAASAEDPSPEVAAAAGRNGLQPEAYFNSGVLLLRMDDPRLPPAIGEAIRVAEQEPQRLVFHDQCALNIAFQGRVAPLPARFNFYLRPGRERNGHIEDGLILHFLDRPKPWDIAFDRGWREEWRVWALLLAGILPQGLHLEIHAAANDE